MVGSSFIDIHTLTLDELAGVVNLYPWYGAARVELCSRMSRMGEDWGEHKRYDFFVRHLLGLTPPKWGEIQYPKISR